MLLLGALLGACGAPTAAPRTAPSPPPHAPPVTPPPPVSAEPEASAPPVVSEPVAEPAAPPDEEYVDLSERPAARGVSEKERKKLPHVYMSCQPQAVGPEREEALLCHAWESVERGKGTSVVFRTRLRDSIFGVQKGRIVVMLDAIVGVTITDKEDMAQPNIVDLALEVAPDGLSAELTDGAPPLRSCDEALADLGARVKTAQVTAWDRFDLDLTKRACAQRGHYVFRGGRFVRAVATPPRGGTSGP